MISRSNYYNFKEYHTSLDNLSKFNFKIFFESVEKILDILETIEINSKPKSTVLYGTHQFSRRGSNLYEKIFYKNKKSERTKILLQILNLSEGKIDFLDIANEKNFSLLDNKALIENMIKEKLIKIKKIF